MSDDLASLRTDICAEIAGAFQRLESRIEELQQENQEFHSKICGLEASNQQVLRELQLLRSDRHANGSLATRPRSQQAQQQQQAPCAAGLPVPWASHLASAPDSYTRQARGIKCGPGPVGEAAEESPRMKLEERVRLLSGSMDAEKARSGKPPLPLDRMECGHIREPAPRCKLSYLFQLLAAAEIPPVHLPSHLCSDQTGATSQRRQDHLLGGSETLLGTDGP
mmetsp:Transcript_38000/g.107337  ORF Transcript_38000/g.107337 Transcript_38000/m.107337 type:complete len:223 (-) Transcript_38000:2497-3165(-)